MDIPPTSDPELRMRQAVAALAQSDAALLKQVLMAFADGADAIVVMKDGAEVVRLDRDPELMAAVAAFVDPNSAS
jgi:hypothetical protein